MKLVTHLITSASVAVMTVLLLNGSGTELAASVVLAVLANWLIDLGHVRGRYGPRRSEFTHSLTGASTLSLTLYLVFKTVPLGLDMGAVALVALLLSGITHLLLDSLTEGGTYFLWPFTRRRYALAHLDYDDPIINSLVVLVFTLPTLYLLYMYRGEFVDWFVRYVLSK